MPRQFAEFSVQRIHRHFLFDDFGNALIETRRRFADALDGLQSAAKVTSAFTQLSVQLRRSGFVPQLDFTERGFIDHPQACGQRAHQPFGELGLRELEHVVHTEVLQVAALHSFQVVFVTHQFGHFGGLQ